MKRSLAIALLLGSGMVLSAAAQTPAATYVQIPPDIRCSIEGVTVDMVSDAQGNVKYLPGGSVKSITCTYSETRKEIPLASAEVKDGEIQTASFGNLRMIMHDATTAGVEIEIRADLLPALRAFLGAPPLAVAPTSSADAAKIAVISFQAAVGATNEGQKNFNDLEKKFDPKRQQLKALSDEIDSETKDLQAKGATLSDADRASRSKEIDTKKKLLDRDVEDARNDFQQQMQDLYQALASKVYDVMQSYAEKEGYTLVLDISEQQSPVLFASNSTNITKQVIDAYNLKSGVPAPPPQSNVDAPKPAAPSASPSH